MVKQQKLCYETYEPNERTFDFWINVIILNTIVIIGTIGNVLSIFILSRPKMRSSINCLLIGLAICDTMLILSSMFVYGFASIYPYTGSFFYYHYNLYPKYVRRVLFPLMAASRTSSIYLTLMVSVERYVAVCHPLRARSLCTYGRAKYYIAFCTCFAIAFNLVKFWERYVVEDDHPELGLIYCVAPTELRVDPNYKKIYIYWCSFIIMNILPFIGLLIFNILIYRQIVISNKKRQRLSRTEKREIGLATMLICVVIVFFLLNSLSVYIKICEVYFDRMDPMVNSVSNMLITLNSSVNFIIYVIYGEKFKRIFLSLFCKRICRRMRNKELPDEVRVCDNNRNATERATRECNSMVKSNGDITPRTSTSTSTSLNSGGGSDCGGKKLCNNDGGGEDTTCLLFTATELQQTLSILNGDGVTGGDGDDICNLDVKNETMATDF